MRILHPAFLLAGWVLFAQEDPLAAPPEFHQWARQTTLPYPATRAKLQALLEAIFSAAGEGRPGLGITYDNTRTRTVQEVWSERKANCLSLTAFYVAACRVIGVDAKYAEPTNTNRWRRVGNLVRFERHVVSVVAMPPIDELVADFLPQLRNRRGVYIVDLLAEPRFRSLFHSNRAVELMEEGNAPAALEQAERGIKADLTSPVGWNIKGVVLKSTGRLAEAEACFKYAILLDPKDGTPVGNLEMLVRSQGRLEEAMQYRAQGLNLRRHDPYYHSFLAEEAFEEGRFAEATKEVKLAIKIQPHESDFHLLQARIHLQMGNPNGALDSLEKARRWAIPEERERYDSKLAALRKKPK